MCIAARLGIITVILGSGACFEGVDHIPSASPDCPGPGADGRPCDDGDSCTAYDSCSGGVCRGFAIPEGAPCDDNKACTTGDTCHAGVCDGTMTDCSGSTDACNFGICDPETGRCEALAHPEGSPCDDGDPCTVPGICIVGECVDQVPVNCSHLNGPCTAGSCDPETGTCQQQLLADDIGCDDGEPCTRGEICRGGVCTGSAQPNGSACDDGNACTERDTCIDGFCFAQPVVNGEPCDDGNSCTVSDVCLDGACTDAVDLCLCESQPDDTGCDDANPCTENDLCTAGACEGTLIDCGLVDDACNLGVCDPATGECGPQPLLAGTPCFDDNPCTLNDICRDGACVGQDLDCSSVEDTCHTSRCDAASGDCIAVPKGDRTPCDDGDPCTPDEICLDGICASGTEICTACSALALEDPCDDESACTSDEICVQIEAVLACVGNRTDCSDLDNGCNVGACEPSTGACFVALGPDGVACEDGDPCTELDVCNDGQCDGPPVRVCDIEPTACEPFEDNDLVSVATPIMAPLPERDVVMRGRIAVAGETDWYAVTLGADEGFSVETRPDCGSELNTVLAIFDTNGVDLLALNDDFDGGPWSRIADFASSIDGTYFIQVSAYASSGTGTYNLRLEPGGIATCISTDDCGCATLVCQGNKCLPSIATEIEPNAVAGDASAAVLDGTVAGRLGATEVDMYSIDLSAGMPIEVETLSFCDDAPVDTQITIFGPDGVSALAFNDDFGGAVLAHLPSFTAGEAGTYYIGVTAGNFDSGRYRLAVYDRRCLSNSDCACTDQLCDGVGGASGLCVPALSEIEPNGGDGTPTLMISGERRHGIINQAGDVDRFEARLQPGTYDIDIFDYCGESIDTILTLWDRDATALLAQNDDGGVDLLSSIHSFEVTVTQWVVFGVTARGSAVGAYVLGIQELP